jgi:FAD synthetase
VNIKTCLFELLLDDLKLNEKKIVVAGSFDILHPGHIYLLKEAAKLGLVYVIVARDSTIKKIKKVCPIIPEEQRLEVIQALKYVHIAVLGNEGSEYIDSVLEFSPDIVLLGPNQKISNETLEQKLAERNAQHIKVQRIQDMYNKYELNSSSSIKHRIISRNNQDS